MATTVQIIALGQDSDFRQRVRTLMLQAANIVYAEAPATPNHAARAVFASKIAQNPGLADSLAPAVAVNLGASTVTYDFDNQRVLTDATDAQIRSQIAADWNMLAGI